MTFSRSREVNDQPVNFKPCFNIILGGVRVVALVFIASNYV